MSLHQKEKIKANMSIKIFETGKHEANNPLKELKISWSIVINLSACHDFHLDIFINYIIRTRIDTLET